jgi:outer membrane protein
VSSHSNGLAAYLLLACVGCVGTPSVNGVPGVPPSSSAPWTPPREIRVRDSVAARPSVPADLEQQIRRLTLAEVVDLGLRNNPTTRLSWANARAAAAAYGSARGAYLPTIDDDLSSGRD